MLEISVCIALGRGCICNMKEGYGRAVVYTVLEGLYTYNVGGNMS
jgi:hypothetical protein